ncbi:autophagy-related protein 7 [Hordeum vulgare]|nr:autophagy-related protein 7 [Hordeum vulgare]
MILRTRTGEVVFAAYRKLFHCNDALEAELQALLEGIKLTTEHSEAPIMIQSDCVAAINAIKDTSLNNSAYGHMIQEIKFLLSDRVFIPVKVSRAQNRVADCLANYGRSGDSTACWLGMVAIVQEFAAVEPGHVTRVPGRSSFGSRSDSDVDYDNKLALRIVLERSKMDTGGSSESGASP